MFNANKSWVKWLAYIQMNTIGLISLNISLTKWNMALSKDVGFQSQHIFVIVVMFHLLSSIEGITIGSCRVMLDTWPVSP